MEMRKDNLRQRRKRLLPSAYCLLPDSGFTLLELLVVISIIGLLAGLVMVSFTGVQKQARDATRKSDLKQYQTALENYANKNMNTGGGAFYPARSTSETSSSLCSDLGLTGCPVDPKSPSQDYNYCSNGSLSDGTANATQYAMWARLENQTNTYWVVCSSGKVGTSTAVPACGSSFSCLP